MWAILFVLIAVVMVTGNVAVLVVFTRTPALRKRKHYLLVNLAVADLLVGVISVPMYATVLVAEYSDSIRMIYNIEDPLLGSASVFGLAAVAIERAYAVYFPFKHRTLRKGVYMIGIAVIWIMAAFPGFCFVIFDSLVPFNAANMVIVLSLAVIIISYFLIWIKINYTASVQGHAIRARDNRLTVTLVIVTLISLIAWIPFNALSLYLKYNGNHNHISNLDDIVYGIKLLHYSNSLINPIIYALRMPQYQTALLQGLRRCLTCNSCYDNMSNTIRANHVSHHVFAGHHHIGLRNFAKSDDELDLVTLDNPEVQTRNTLNSLAS